jgi:deoxyuridine 5'-triphosphate nucleotidohydrolase
MQTIKFKKLTEDAIIPSTGSKYAAGLDLSSIIDITVRAGRMAKISTGLAVAVPLDSYFRLAPRSGLAAKYEIDVLAGVVDSDYRGELIVILKNLGENDFVVAKGDRIAQGIVEKIYLAEVVEVKELPVTERGESGLGSTGK